MHLTKYLVELPLPISLYDCKEGEIAKVYLVELPIPTSLYDCTEGEIVSNASNQGLSSRVACFNISLELTKRSNR